MAGTPPTPTPRSPRVPRSPATIGVPHVASALSTHTRANPSLAGQAQESSNDACVFSSTTKSPPDTNTIDEDVEDDTLVTRENSGNRRPLYLWEAPGTEARVLEERRAQLLRMNLDHESALRAELHALLVAIAHTTIATESSSDAGKRGTRSNESPTGWTMRSSSTDPVEPTPVLTRLAATPISRGGGGRTAVAKSSDAVARQHSTDVAVLDDVVDFSDIPSDASYANLACATSVSRSVSSTSTAPSSSPPSTKAQLIRRISRPPPPPPSYTPQRPSQQQAPDAYHCDGIRHEHETQTDRGHNTDHTRPTCIPPVTRSPVVAAAWTEHRAAVVIQARWRGHTVRKKTALMQRRQIRGQLPSRAFHGPPVQAFATGHGHGPSLRTVPILPLDSNFRRVDRGGGDPRMLVRTTTPSTPSANTHFSYPHVPAHSHATAGRAGASYTHMTQSVPGSAPRRPAAVTAVPQAVPPGWSAAIDSASGRPYFINHLTGMTQWEHPTCPDALLSPPMTPRPVFSQLS